MARAAFVVVLTIVLTSYAQAATVQVGPARTYKTVAAGVAAAVAGDTIEIDAGVYTGAAACATINQNNLTIKGVGGRPKLDAFGVDVGGKGIFFQNASDLKIDNIEFANAVCASQNGAGIRAQGNNLTVQNCYFHECQDGILNGQGVVIIQNCEFFDNGFGSVGFTHNVYIAATCSSLTFQYNYTHGCYVGHDLKTRALVNYVLYNRITDENGTGSYNIDMPQGGTAYIIGNLIQKGPNSQNQHMIAYKEEGGNNPDEHLYVINNTLVNDLGWGTFVWNQSSTTAAVANNIFFGAGIPVEGPATQTANLTTSDPALFVDRAGYNYRLSASSAAINAGVAPGVGITGFSLTPTLQYLHPLNSQPRPSSGVLDIGAYEFSPNSITGTISNAAPGATITLSGASAAVTASGLNGGYSFNGLANGAYTLTVSQPGYTFSPASTPVTISGANVIQNFNAATYSVTLAAGSNGASDLSGVQSAAIGNTISAHAFPAGGFHFVNWTDNSNPSTIVSASATLTASQAQAGKIITANFEANGSYSVSFAAGANGTVSPAGQQSASSGSTISVTATANPSFQFLNWTDNAGGAVVGASATLLVDSSLEGRTLTANFGPALAGFRVLFVAGPHGSIFGITPQIVGHSTDTMPVLATADAGYHFVNWTGTHYFVTTSINPVGDSPGVTGDDVNKTITANFAPDTYAISGAVSGAPDATLVTITLTLPDLSKQTAHPAANGTYSFAGLLAGSYTVAPSLSGYTFSPASAAVTLINVDAAAPTFTAGANQTISFGVLTGKTYGDAPFVLSAATSSGLPVSFTVVSGPAKLSGNTLTITGAGAVTIKASQAGNATYAAAADVFQSFAVSSASLTVSGVVVNDKIYDGAAAATVVLSGAKLQGIIGTDDVKLDAAQTLAAFLDANPGMSKPATVTLALTGAAAGNYVLIQPAGLTANIFAPGSALEISSVLATPSSVLTGEAVSFVAGVNVLDASGGPLTYVWNFGDGATSTLTSPTHAFTTGGTKNVTVTVSDSHLHSVSGVAVVEVAAPLPLSVASLTGTVHFGAQARTDSAKISGTLSGVPAPFSPLGKTLTLNISGAAIDFTLGATGKASTPHGTIALKLTVIKAPKSVKGVKSAKAYQGGAIPFKATLKGGTYAPAWGLSAQTPSSNIPLQVTLTLDGVMFSSGPLSLKYTPAKLRGAFKK